MKLSPNKTFPHPVLRSSDSEDALGGDYVRRAFQVTRDFSVDDDDAPVMSFSFEISEEYIVELLRKNLATYAIEIYCPETFVRRVFYTSEETGKWTLKKGELYRQVEVSAFVVCTESVQGYSSTNFNLEFGENASFDLLPGDVLAATDMLTYYWDTEGVESLYSVFDIVGIEAIEAGMFAVDTSGDRVEIQMHPKDKARFEHMRQSKEQKPMAMFFYFSVLAEVLQHMKEDKGDGGMDKKWYRAIEYKLDDKDKGLSDTFKVAQKLFEKPLGNILPPLGSGD